MRRLAALVLGAAVCLSPQKQAPKIVFENILKGSGIRYLTDNSATSNKHQVETMLAGVAVFDYNKRRPSRYLFRQRSAAAGDGKI